MNQMAAIKEDPRDDLRDRLAAFANILQDEARDRVSRRAPIEKRWLRDLEQYHGLYDEKTRQTIDKNKGSGVFLNLTKPKTDLMSARLWELLFPTDDKNWGIKPTPIPQLTEGAARAIDAADKAEKKAAEAEGQADALQDLPEGATEADAAQREAQFNQLEAQRTQAVGAAQQARTKADEIQAIIDEANTRASDMEDEINDQLVECGYAQECRKVIDDGAQIGFGVLKGPVAGDRPRKQWVEVDGMYQMKRVYDPTRPAAHWVDPWSFFPDPDASCMEDGQGFYERHLWKRGQLRQFAKRPGVDKKIIEELLGAKPAELTDVSYLTQLFAISGEQNVQVKDRYAVWEYTGPVEGDNLKTLIQAFDPDSTQEEISELEEIGVKIWFCNGKILKFDQVPLESGDPIYSVFSVAEDSASIFGYGVPALMRDPQAIINAGQRAMMDNARMTVGPQIGINRKYVDPQDNSYELTPFKVWNIKEGIQDIKQAFSTFDIPTRQVEFSNIIELARAAIDEVTAMPQIAQGEQGPTPQQTASGMAMLMNAANVTFRRIVKMFDDNITVPVIQRFYDWNMQFNENDDLKGDFEIDARGSSVLLVREMQANNLLLAMNIPLLADLIAVKDDGLGMARTILKSMMLDPKEILPTEDELEKARQNQQADPEMMRLQQEAELKEKEIDARIQESSARVAVAEMQASSKLQEAQMHLDTEMMKVAEGMNMQFEEFRARLQMTRETAQAAIEKQRIQTQSAERKLATEVAMKQRTGDSAGGSV